MSKIEWMDGSAVKKLHTHRDANKLMQEIRKLRCTVFEELYLRLIVCWSNWSNWSTVVTATVCHRKLDSKCMVICMKN